ncbi:MAG: hypothetical protein ACFFC3_09400 [Candidatus Odinarchaeota archaeon]
MTQTLKKQDIEVMNSYERYSKFYKNPLALRPKVLSCLFRNITLTSKRNGKILALGKPSYTLLSNLTDTPILLVHKFVNRFLVDIIRFRKFLTLYPETLNSRNHSKKVHIYLHKLYRLAPIFNYNRAKENVRRLQIILRRIYYEPQIMTQIAFIIFITDFLDTKYPQKIIQSNLQMLCSCSAYSFHRLRNKIGLTPKNMKSMKKNHH